jgi:hypothetical protein
LVVLLTALPVAADDVVSVDTTLGQNGGGSADVVLHPQEPGAPGDTSAGADATDRRTGSSSTCTYLDQEIDCTSSKGVWSQDRQCFVRKLDVEVSDQTPFQGHTEGAVFRCSTPGSAGGGPLGVGPGSSYLFWAPASGSGTPDLVDPVTLAREAIERMRLAAPRIGMTPVDPDAPLLVGIDAWLWVDNDDARGYGPISRTATAGSTAVTARAKVTKVVWDMGDGARVTCRNPGTRWTAAQGTGPSPTCGHRYEVASTGQPGETYTVRATAHWAVDWTGAGQAGRITFRLTGTRQVEVTELQVLQTR